jgi:hypothetical protein
MGADTRSGWSVYIGYGHFLFCPDSFAEFWCEFGLVWGPMLGVLQGKSGLQIS